jgi:hypothetical protein
MKRWRATVLAFIGLQTVSGDTLVFAPALRPGNVGDPPQTGTWYPFLSKLTVPAWSVDVPTMRYQQVCAASLFTNAGPAMIYVTSVTVWPDYPTGFSMDWAVPRMQINLSTTSNRVDGLSLVFQENVGVDDTVVFGPTGWGFSGSFKTRIPFDRAFRYYPTNGNLLIDVRIMDGRGSWNPGDSSAATWAYNSPTDEVSRAWATNVAALSADGADTTGFRADIQLSPVPSLRIYWISPPASGLPGTNLVVDRPTTPPGFVLQETTTLGPDASWRLVTNAPFISNEVNQIYLFPAASVRQGSLFYRLISN